MTKEDRHEAESIDAAVRFCTMELDNLREHGEIPRLVEIWYLAVVSSFPSFLTDSRGQEKAEVKLLMNAISLLLQQEMKRVPCFKTVVQQKVTVVKELSSTLTSADDSRARQEEIMQIFQDQCDQFIGGLVESVHLLLQARDGSRQLKL